MKPNFLVIGEQKCGTGWVRDRLREHPEVYFSPKEVNYFNSRKNYARGDKWYATHFKDIGATAIGEKSPEYFWQHSGRADYHQDIFQRINERLPQGRIVLILRSPVDRAISALMHHVRHRGRRIHPKLVKSEVASSILFSAREEFSHWGILDRGFYSDRLIAAKQAFGDRLLVLIFEQDIVANPISGLMKICTHIGVSAFDEFNTSSNAKEKKSSYGAMLLSYYAPVLRPIIRRCDFGRPFQLSVTDRCKEDLHNFYSDDICATEIVLGQSLPQWRQV